MVESALKIATYPVDTVQEDNRVGAEVARRLREAIGSEPILAVAKRARISPRTLTRYLAGDSGLKLSTLIAVADATSTSVEWLATGRDGAVVPAPTDASSARYVPIPRYNVAASAGGGAIVDHPQVVEHFAFADDYLRNQLHRRPQELALIEATGDSMEPVVRDGDILTVDVSPDQRLHNSRLYVIRVDDTLLVKRVEVRTTGLVLHSENTRYQPEIISRADAEHLCIIGQVLLITAPPR